MEREDEDGGGRIEEREWSGARARASSRDIRREEERSCFVGKGGGVGRLQVLSIDLRRTFLLPWVGLTGVIGVAMARMIFSASHEVESGRDERHRSDEKGDNETSMRVAVMMLTFGREEDEGKVHQRAPYRLREAHDDCPQANVTREIRVTKALGHGLAYKCNVRDIEDGLAEAEEK